MSNFETMNALRWKIDQVHTKVTPKTFLKSLRGGEVVKRETWTSDILLYILLIGTVVAFVWIVVKFAKDYKPF